MRTDDADAYAIPIDDGPPQLVAAPDVVCNALRSSVTTARWERIQHVARGRTDHVALVLDRVTDPHNVSAVLRSADAFGVQNVYVIEPELGFFASRAVSKGTHRWLDLHRFQSTEACLERVHNDGYSVYVASMEGTKTPESIPEERVAVVLGNEHTGVSSDLRALADGTFAIPMRGFVESLNVSVAGAVTLRALTHNRPTITEEAAQRLQARFLMASVRDSTQIVQHHQQSSAT